MTCGWVFQSSHTCTHACTRTHPHTHTLKHVHIYTYTHTHTVMCTHFHMIADKLVLPMTVAKYTLEVSVYRLTYVYIIYMYTYQSETVFFSRDAWVYLCEVLQLLEGYREYLDYFETRAEVGHRFSLSLIMANLVFALTHKHTHTHVRVHAHTRTHTHTHTQ